MRPGRHWAEVAAEELLVERGWRLVARNYGLRGGELDLVFYDDGGTLVFVEVRQRGSDLFGGAAASIDSRKMARLRRTAEHFITYGLPKVIARDSEHHAPRNEHEPRMRFDAVLVAGVERHYSTSHVKDIL
ncbi:MAG TPA: YraN family protein [Trueperaceae bacterium]|nr:YraN family protein [Trueperaceae bacterium]